MAAENSRLQNYLQNAEDFHAEALRATNEGNMQAAEEFERVARLALKLAEEEAAKNGR